MIRLRRQAGRRRRLTRMTPGEQLARAAVLVLGPKSCFCLKQGRSVSLLHASLREGAATAAAAGLPACCRAPPPRAGFEPDRLSMLPSLGAPPGRAVISAYFEEKGLVRQQLDSFNDFINTSLQEIVDENKLITVKPQSQHMPGMQVDDDVEKTHEVGCERMGCAYQEMGGRRWTARWRTRRVRFWACSSTCGALCRTCHKLCRLQRTHGGWPPGHMAGGLGLCWFQH